MNDEESKVAYEGLKDHLLMTFDIDIEELNPNSPDYQPVKGEETKEEPVKEEPKKEKKFENYLVANAKIILRSGHGFLTFDQSAVTTGESVSLESVIQIIQPNPSENIFALKGTKKYLHLSKNGVRLDPELKPECKFIFEYPPNENERVALKSASSKDMYLSVQKSFFKSAQPNKSSILDTTFEVAFMDDIVDIAPIGTQFLLKTHHSTYLSLSKDGLIHRKVDKPTKAEVFEFVMIDNRLALKAHHLDSFLMVDDDGIFKFTKSMAKKIRFQMHVFRIHQKNTITFFMLRNNQFLSCKKSTFGKFTVSSVNSVSINEEYELCKLK
jgi:hypothetical protein